MSNKKQQIPAIRFKGFTDAWEQRKLDNLVTQIIREVPKPDHPYERISVRSHAKGTFHQKVEDPKTIAMDKLFVVKENDLIVNITFAWEHAIAVANKSDDGLLVSHRFPTYRAEGKSDIDFLHYVVSQESFRRKLEFISPGGAGRNRVLNKKDFLDLKVSIPSNIDEQQKIGTFFKQIDDTIDLHQRQLNNIKQLKKYMMQKIFNQEICFKDNNGKVYSGWKSFKLSDIVDRVTRKNIGLTSELPLTISAQYGLVDQLTFFNKSIAGINLEGYYLLRRGEFAYNKSYSAGYPFGAIKRLEKYDMGLLSTLYICFSPKDVVNSDFLAQYFESTKWHKQIVNISGEGARNHGLLNIAIGDFFNTKHYLPCIEEQKKIAEILFSLDKQVENAEKKVTLLKEQKKGLMQIMFL